MVQRPSDSLRVPLSRLRAEPQATWVHIRPHSRVPSPSAPSAHGIPGCHMGSHGLLLRLSVSEYLSVSVPLSVASTLSPFCFSTCCWPLSFPDFIFPFCPSLSLVLFAYLSVFNCLWLPFCASLSLSPFFLCLLPALFLSLFISLSLPISISICVSLYPSNFSFPSPTPCHSSRTGRETNS